MTSLRQVSWLADRRPSPPSRTSHCDAQWHVREMLTADSCGGSSGFGPKSTTDRTGFPLGRSTQPAYLSEFIERTNPIGVKPPISILLKSVVFLPHSMVSTATPSRECVSKKPAREPSQKVSEKCRQTHDHQMADKRRLCGRPRTDECPFRRRTEHYAECRPHDGLRAKRRDPEFP
jgi:hypothetical protein